MADKHKSMIDTAGFLEPGKSNLQLIYILYLAGLNRGHHAPRRHRAGL